MYHLILYLLMRYLQSTYPKITNLQLILYIICGPWAVMKWGILKDSRLYKLVLHVFATCTEQVVPIHKHITLF